MDTTNSSQTPHLPTATTQRDRGSPAVRALLAPHRETLLARIAAGERLSDIAAALGLPLDRYQISAALRSDPDYRAARETGLEAILDRADRDLEQADPDRAAHVARARAVWAAAAWRCEREAPHRWGQRIESRVDAQLTIQVVRHGVSMDVSTKAIEHSEIHENSEK